MTAPDLKTPTDLKSNETKSVAQALNGALADSYALYLKTCLLYTSPSPRD